jgi:hypothetical protein
MMTKSAAWKGGDVARIAIGALCLCLALTPVTASWLVLRAILIMEESQAERKEPPTSVKTPSPSREPIWFWGPFEVLTYTNPWYAGTIVFWAYPGLLLIGGYSLLAPFLVVRDTPQESGRFRSARLFCTVALLLGLLFALPWFNCLYTALVTHPYR